MEPIAFGRLDIINPMGVKRFAPMRSIEFGRPYIIMMTHGWSAVTAHGSDSGILSCLCDRWNDATLQME